MRRRRPIRIVLLCQVLKVFRSSYYAWCEGEAARRARQTADDALAHEITVVHVRLYADTAGDPLAKCSSAAGW
ncbi:hypothetical protein ACH4C6_34265 [Streptomyces sp. NPDC017943]|uniref:hypothetical protein n=1 Tax=Streptomyces sp. NPDC017943 TaxID=3365019 RepID=UPI0037B3F32B